MNRKQLSGVLEELAEGDLAKGGDLQDHPCMVAIRMIDKAFEDVETLQQVARDHHGTHSKHVSLLIWTPYNPKV